MTDLERVAAWSDKVCGPAMKPNTFEPDRYFVDSHDLPIRFATAIAEKHLREWLVQNGHRLEIWHEPGGQPEFGVTLCDGVEVTHSGWGKTLLAALLDAAESEGGAPG